MKSRKPASSFASSAPTLEFERGAGFPLSPIIGVDEVGRGCLAGPVVAAAVILPFEWDLTRAKLVKRHVEIEAITDSKAISPKKREELSPWIRANVRAFGIGSATVEEIDRINIYHASHLAMERAVAALIEDLVMRGLHALTDPIPHVLVDGNAIPKGFLGNATAIVKGDLRSLSIACASIIAKVHRDQKMCEIALEHPGFGFEIHKGYATPMHRKALEELGPTPWHRRSFAPVREAYDAETLVLEETQAELFRLDP